MHLQNNFLATYYFSTYYNDENKDVLINCSNKDHSDSHCHLKLESTSKLHINYYSLMMANYVSEVIKLKKENYFLKGHSFRLLFQYPSELDTKCTIDGIILTNQGKIGSSTDSQDKLKKAELQIMKKIQGKKHESCLLLRCYADKDFVCSWSWFDEKSEKYLKTTDHLLPETLINSNKQNPDNPPAIGYTYDSLDDFLNQYKDNSAAQDQDETDDILPEPSSEQTGNSPRKQQDNAPVLLQKETASNVQPDQISGMHSDYFQETESRNSKSVLLSASKKLHTCTLCKKSFTSKSYLKLHTQGKHNKETPYKCSYCGKSYSWSSSLYCHIKISHTKERQHQCSDCKRFFLWESHLKKHCIALHSKKKAYQCDDCDKSYYWLCNLRQHISSTHAEKKPLKYDECDSVFSDKGSLTKHMSTHKKNRPYTCEHCDKGFTRKEHLTKHTLVHTKEKPYICPVCQYTCNQKGNLKVHMRVHTQKKTYKCTSCDKIFSHNNSLTRHKHRNHNI